MLRPEKVQDALEVTDDRVHFGRYGEFVLHSAYQPIFQISQQAQPTLVAMEGLIRPFHGSSSISPLQLFEMVDQDDALFIECMCQALHIRNYCHATPQDRTLFVNLNPAIYDSVPALEKELSFAISQLGKYGLAHHKIVFELLETVPYSTAILQKMRLLVGEFGVPFAIDDFGRGSSNFERYNMLKPDVVKIDGDFFAQCTTDMAVRSFVQSMISRAHDDGAQVIIEGIENQSMLNLAQHMGGDLAQGFFLAKPCVLPHDFSRPCEAFDLANAS